MAGKIKIGIIGCGTIGAEIARACQDRLKAKMELAAVCDTDQKKAELFNRSLKKKAQILKMDELMRKVDLVIEAASAHISGDVLKRCIKINRDCLIMSVGGLLGKEELLESAKKKGVKIYIPSGALCGIDALKAASIGKIEGVTLTTRKPTKGLDGAPYLKEAGLDLSNIKRETAVFEGSAAEAVKGFPQNINVSATLSLAGLGAARTLVRIITSPEYTKNIHELEITGDFGRIITRTENVPSKANPKTSTLAILSAIATLESIANSVRIGT